MNITLIFLRLILPLFAGVLLLTSCISVNIGAGVVAKSRVVNFKEPSDLFKPFNATAVDKAWRHSKDGNTISFISQCEEGVGFSLEDVKTATINEIESPKLIEDKEISFNKRSAKSLIILGAMDGVPSQVKVVIFRKHDCLYSITYVSKPEFFKKHVGVFDFFLAGFEVP